MRTIATDRMAAVLAAACLVAIVGVDALTQDTTPDQRPTGQHGTP